MNLKRLFSRFLWMSLSIGIVSCAKETPYERDLPEVDEVQNVDTGLVTNQPCAPPCWQGISPGDPRSEVIEILDEITVIDHSTLGEYSRSIQFGGGQITFDENDEVLLIGQVLEYRLEIQELIEIMGEPDGFKYNRHLNAKYGEMILYWPQSGLNVSVPSSIEHQYVTEEAPIQPDSLVYAAGYFAPAPDAETLFLRDAEPSEYEDMTIFEFYAYYQWEGFVPLPHY